MAEVSTETSSPHSQGGNRFRGPAANVTVMMDRDLLRYVLAILMIIEIVLGMIHWALIASTPSVHTAAYGWVMFVAVTLWLLTIGLFVVGLFSINRMISVPWVLVMMMYNGVAAVLYLTAFLTNAATAHRGFFFEAYLGAAAVSSWSCDRKSLQ
ncbi:Plasmolipin Plasma membrane proteolipid [Takifugu flavidus]|uniref:Plasmolipin n=1 Tax=Takifugu flavidus TaxID=433684 RepID=A0A5C6PDI0_9TELE|nr:Plasmolipin Plasma membrane proteolipid [Takifugu flavidus]